MPWHIMWTFQSDVFLEDKIFFLRVIHQRRFYGVKWMVRKKKKKKRLCKWPCSVNRHWAFDEVWFGVQIDISRSSGILVCKDVLIVNYRQWCDGWTMKAFKFWIKKNEKLIVVSGQEQRTIKPNYVVNFLELILWCFISGFKAVSWNIWECRTSMSNFLWNSG